MTAHDIVLIRHGQTEWSISGRHTGRTDIPLTDLGRQQADALGEMLDGESFPTVLSSPLQRAWETMERAGYAAQGIASQDILEWDYGVFDAARACCRCASAAAAAAAAFSAATRSASAAAASTVVAMAAVRWVSDSTSSMGSTW